MFDVMARGPIERPRMRGRHMNCDAGATERSVVDAPAVGVLLARVPRFLRHALRPARALPPDPQSAGLVRSFEALAGLGSKNGAVTMAEEDRPPLVPGAFAKETRRSRPPAP